MNCLLLSSGNKNISILHLSCRTSDIQFSLVRQTNALALKSVCNKEQGAQWLSGRKLDSRTRGGRFDLRWRHCVMSLSKKHSSLLSTGSTQEDPPPPYITERLLMVRKESNQIKTKAIKNIRE